MLWFLLVILAAFLWALVDLSGKFVMDKEVGDAFLAAGTSGIPEFLILTFVALYFSGIITSLSVIIPSLSVGVFYAVALYTYYLGVEEEDIDRFVPTLSLTTIFTLFLAYFFLGESFSLLVYLGIVGIIAGAVLISMKGIHTFQSKKGFLIGILTALLFSLRDVILKFATMNVSFWSVLFWVGVGGSLTSLFFLLFRFSVVEKSFTGEKHLLEIGFLATFGYLTYVIAISLGPVSLVGAMIKVKILMVFLGSTAISRVHPEIIYEKLDKITIIQKLIAIIVIILGVFLIQMFS